MCELGKDCLQHIISILGQASYMAFAADTVTFKVSDLIGKYIHKSSNVFPVQCVFDLHFAVFYQLQHPLYNQQHTICNIETRAIS